MRSNVEPLVRDGLAIAESVARRMNRRLGGLLDTEELMDIARSVLARAVQQYDPTRTPFAPYLTARLKWAMLDEVRRVCRGRRVRARAAACASLDRTILGRNEEEEAGPSQSLRTDVEYQAQLAGLLSERASALAFGLSSTSQLGSVPAPDEEQPEERLATEQLRAQIRRAVLKLPDRQRLLVERHYFGDERFEVIADELGISKSWASRLHAQAMRTLFEELVGKV